MKIYGKIPVSYTHLTSLKPERLSDYRRDTLGFVFQFYNLIPNLTAEENIQVCGYLSKVQMCIRDSSEIVSQCISKIFILYFLPHIIFYS